MNRRCSFRNVLLAFALVTLPLAGCGTTSTLAPQASSPSSSSSNGAGALSHGPQLGYVWSARNHNIYPLLGVAGATHYGTALLTGSYTSGAMGGQGANATDPTGARAWALLLDSTGTLVLYKAADMTSVVVGTRIPADSTIAFAPSGGYAVAFSLTAQSAVLVSGLSSQPQLAELLIPQGATLAGAAVSDKGTVLAGWSKDAPGALQAGTLSPSGSAVLATLSAWGGAAFVPGAAAGGEQAILADAGTGQLVRLTGIAAGATPVTTVLATEGLLQRPIAVAVSGDAHWAFAGDSAKQQVLRVDLSGSTAPSAIPCACNLSQLVPLPGSMVFQIAADSAAQPAWLLEARAARPRTFFVPALAGSTNTAAAARFTRSATR